MWFYRQQQEAFVKLGMSTFLVFTVLLLEFRSFAEPVAMVFGALLALFGNLLALQLTDTSLDIVLLLDAITGTGITTGIVMLDYVDHLRTEGVELEAALVSSGHRRA